MDNNSTTIIYDREIIKEMNKWYHTGNPSNDLHNLGHNAHLKIEQCRYDISKELNILPKELYFTSGATESNNIAIQGVISYYLRTTTDKYTIITSKCEHSSVLEIFKYWEDYERIEVKYVYPSKDNDNYGCIDPIEVENTIIEANYKLLLVSIMHGNNETGAINDVTNIGKIVHKYNGIYHSDVTQTIGKTLIKPNEVNIDIMTFSGHKFHGPRGIGGLYVNSSIDFDPLLLGGEQENSKRPGTENIVNIVGMTLAFKLSRKERIRKNIRLYSLREKIITELSKIAQIDIIGPSGNVKHNVLPNTILVGIKNMRLCNKQLVGKLNEYGISVSVGSACKKGKISHVLDAMGVCDNMKMKVFRISLSDYTTDQDCKYFIKSIKRILASQIIP